MLGEIKDLYVTVQRRAMGSKGWGIDDMENDSLIFHNFILMIIKIITELIHKILVYCNLFFWEAR